MLKRLLLTGLLGLGLAPTAFLMQAQPVSADVYNDRNVVTDPIQNESDTVAAQYAIDPTNKYINLLVTTNNPGAVVNLRSGPGLEYAVLAQTNGGYTLLSDAQVREKGETYAWHRVLAVDDNENLQYMWIREDLAEPMF